MYFMCTKQTVQPDIRLAHQPCSEGGLWTPLACTVESRLWEKKNIINNTMK